MVITCCQAKLNSPNVARTLGILGGYLWTSGMEDQKAFINVHLYASATLEFPTPQGPVSLSQHSNYPWEADIDFKLSRPESLGVEIRLRIPSWAGNFTVSLRLRTLVQRNSNKIFQLEPPSKDVKCGKGYVTLPPSYLSSNPNFRLSLHNFEPRLISPHPLTGQNTVTLARGPIIYCVEDVDNPWVKDHFKSTAMLDSHSKFVEQVYQDLKLKDDYIGITAVNAGYQLSFENGRAYGSGPSHDGADVEGEAKDLLFIPYYFRANRGGRGHMRVGLKKKI